MEGGEVGVGGVGGWFQELKMLLNDHGNEIWEERGA
jgi:hypothetical protein